jgi:hypothetical protein
LELGKHPNEATGSRLDKLQSPEGTDQLAPKTPMAMPPVMCFFYKKALKIKKPIDTYPFFLA